MRKKNKYVPELVHIIGCILVVLSMYYYLQRPIVGTEHDTKCTNSSYYTANKLVITIPITLEYTKGEYSVHTVKDIRVTAYNNLQEQTDNTPNIGASNRKVFEGSAAVSRDLIRNYKIRYGDIICLLKTDRCYKIEDTMNKRYDNARNPGQGNRVDIFLYDKSTALTVNFTTDMLLIKQR